MADKSVYQCQCPGCRQLDSHPNQALHHRLNVLLSHLDENQRRWYVALEAQKLGHGGTQRMSEITGMHVNTIRRGRRELENDLAEYPVGKIRQAGGGRLAIEKNT